MLTIQTGIALLCSTQPKLILDDQSRQFADYCRNWLCRSSGRKLLERSDTEGRRQYHDVFGTGPTLFQRSNGNLQKNHV